MPLSLRRYSLPELQALLREIEAAIRAAERAERKPRSPRSTPAPPASPSAPRPTGSSILPGAPADTAEKAARGADRREPVDVEDVAACANLAMQEPKARRTKPSPGGPPAERAAAAPVAAESDAADLVAARAALAGRTASESSAAKPATAGAGAAESASRESGAGEARPPAAEPAIRYMHPANRNMTWSGVGTEPEWLTVYLAQGGSWTALENTAQKFAARQR